MKLDFEEIEKMVKASKNCHFDTLEREYQAVFLLLPSWVTEKPLSLEGCDDYEGNEAVYDWMVENGIEWFEFANGKFKFTYGDKIGWQYIENKVEIKEN